MKSFEVFSIFSPTITITVLFGDEFEGDFSFIRAIDALVHFSKRSFSQFFCDGVVSDLF